MRTVAAVFTAQSIVESTKQLFAELVPDCRVVSIIEDALIQDVIRAGQVTPEIARRLIRYYLAAQDTGADLIFNTCSSIGDVAVLARSVVSIPLVKIDDAMAAEAVRMGARVGSWPRCRRRWRRPCAWSEHRQRRRAEPSRSSRAWPRGPSRRWSPGTPGNMTS